MKKSDEIPWRNEASLQQHLRQCLKCLQNLIVKYCRHHQAPKNCFGLVMRSNHGQENADFVGSLQTSVKVSCFCKNPSFPKLQVNKMINQIEFKLILHQTDNLFSFIDLHHYKNFKSQKKSLQTNQNLELYNKQMGWSTNEKALAKRQKEKEQKDRKQQMQQQKKQASKWKDEHTDKKFEQKKKKQQEKMKEQLKKQQKKQLLEKQQQQMEKISKKKQQFETKKLTQAQILINQQRKLAGLDDVSSSSDSQEEKNPNRVQHDFEVAENVQQALNALNFKQDKHPQKRFKAAFLEYCEKREVELKLENPHMKRTQRMDLMRKEFDKHPDNPFNKTHKEFNKN